MYTADDFSDESKVSIVYKLWKKQFPSAARRCDLQWGNDSVPKQ